MAIRKKIEFKKLIFNNFQKTSRKIVVVFISKH